jgi:carbon storage regulator
MLVIRRRAGESLLIGDDVEIEVLDVTPSQVKLGIRAPKSIVVMRKEVQITREQNLQASRAAASNSVKQLLDSVKIPKP